MEVILSTMLSNIYMVAVFLIPLVLTRIADICFGAILSVKDSNQKFDIKKLLFGILNSLVIVLGIFCLVSGLSALPTILDVFDITLVDPEALSSLIDVASIIGILVTTIITYGKDCYNKLLKIFNMKNSDTAKVSTRINESGDEDVRYS